MEEIHSAQFSRVNSAPYFFGKETKKMSKKGEKKRKNIWIVNKCSPGKPANHQTGLAAWTFNIITSRSKD